VYILLFNSGIKFHAKKLHAQPRYQQKSRGLLFILTLQRQLYTIVTISTAVSKCYLLWHHDILPWMIWRHSICRPTHTVLPSTAFIASYRRHLAIICRRHRRPPCRWHASTDRHPGSRYALGVEWVEMQQLLILHLRSEARDVARTEILAQLVHFLQLQQMYSQSLYCTQHLYAIHSPSWTR